MTRAAGLLTVRAAEPATLLVRGAHVVDPGTGIDAVLDVLVRDGDRRRDRRARSRRPTRPRSSRPPV